MTPSKFLADKQYYTIGEVSKYCDLETHTLRYWQKEFSGLNPVTRNGRRYYQKDDIQYIIKIKDLLHHQKYSIKGACELLQNESKATSSTPPSLVTKGIEKELSNRLDSIIDSLKKLI